MLKYQEYIIYLQKTMKENEIKVLGRKVNSKALKLNIILWQIIITGLGKLNSWHCKLSMRKFIYLKQLGWIFLFPVNI